MAEIIKSNETIAQAKTLEEKVKDINRYDSIELRDTV